MPARTYKVYPRQVRGYAKEGFFTVIMDDATRKRYLASTPEEQANYLKFNATFHPLKFKVNTVSGVDKLEPQ